MPRLAESVTIGELTVPNRLYRAPLLECAGTDADTPQRLIKATRGVGPIMGITVVGSSRVRRSLAARLVYCRGV